MRFDELSFAQFLEQFDELAEQDFFDEKADAVTLLTIHAAKGLEFGHVFLIGFEEGILPHAPRQTTKRRLATSERDAPQLSGAELEEEKRLFYVAATRARERLTLLHAKTRVGQPAQLSQFAAGLTGDVLRRLDDPNLKTQTTAAQKRRAKNAQMGLF